MDDYFICIGDEDRDGFTEAGGDCNNQDPEINPAAEEIPNDGIDQDCDGEDLITSVEEISQSLGWIPGQPQPQSVVRMDCYSLDGRLICTSPEEFNSLPNGIYLVRLLERDGMVSTMKYGKR